MVGMSRRDRRVPRGDGGRDACYWAQCMRARGLSEVKTGRARGWPDVQRASDGEVAEVAIGRCLAGSRRVRASRGRGECATADSRDGAGMQGRRGSRWADVGVEECYGQGWRDVVSSGAIVSHPCRQRGGVSSAASDQAAWEEGVSSRPKLYATVRPLAATVQGLGRSARNAGAGGGSRAVRCCDEGADRQSG